MTPAPVLKPKGMSRDSGSRFRKSSPADSIKRASSWVVSTKSTSGRPSTANSGRLASIFLAVQGMMETTTRFSRATPSFSGKSFFTREPNICCGERQVERLGNSSG